MHRVSLSHISNNVYVGSTMLIVVVVDWYATKDDERIHLLRMANIIEHQTYFAS